MALYVLVVHHVRVKYQIHISMKVQERRVEECTSQQPYLNEESWMKSNNLLCYELKIKHQGFWQRAEA